MSYLIFVYSCFVLSNLHLLVDRSLKRRQVKPLAASLLDALDYDSSDDSDFEVGDASGKHCPYVGVNILTSLKKVNGKS